MCSLSVKVKVFFLKLYQTFQSETYVRVTHVKVHARSCTMSRSFLFFWEIQAVRKVNYEIETCTHSKNLANSVRVRISSKHMASYKTTHHDIYGKYLDRYMPCVLSKRMTIRS